MIKRALLATLVCLPLKVYLQTPLSVTDSVRRYLLTAAPDTGKCYLLLRLTQSPDCPTDTLLQYSKHWYNYTLQHRITAGSSEALYAMGLAWSRKGNNNEALGSLYKAATAWEVSGSNPLQLARTYELIAGIHKTLGHYRDALGYYLESLQLKKKQNNELLLLSTYNGLGNTYRLLEKTDSAIFYLEKTHTLATGNMLAMAQVSNNLGNIYWSLKNFQLAVQWYKKALAHFTALHQAAGIAETNFNLGAVATQQQQYDLAIQYYNQSLTVAPTGQPLEHLEWTYRHLADAYFKTGKLKQAYFANLKYNEIKDSNLSLNLQRSIADLKEQYETQKKEHALAMEQARTARLSIVNSSQVRLIYILVGVTLLILALSYLLFRNMKRKQLLSEELAGLKEKEKQQLIQEQALKNSVARLEGREMERQRISRDLHDRVGGTLSSVMLFVQRLRGGSPANEDITSKVEPMLREAIEDVRRISHDLSDRILQLYGLREALTDMKDTARLMGNINVALSYQVSNTLPEHVEAETYYICRELLTNAIKHSKASSLSIQLLQEGAVLYLTVEDDGVGFDPASATSGIGLLNIKTRAGKINAPIDIDSHPGRGACFSLIIPLQ